MSLAVTHAKVSAVTDGSDTSFVQPSDWNAGHTLTGTASVAQGGTGQGTFSPSLVLFTSTTSASNVGTADTDLMSYPMLAGQLATNGNKVRVTVWGSFAANTNTKFIDALFGATNVFTFGGAQNGTNWKITAIIVRTGAATQISEGDAAIGSGNGSVKVATPAETLSGAVTIKVTGRSATGSNDVTALGMMVEFLP